MCFEPRFARGADCGRPTERGANGRFSWGSSEAEKPGLRNAGCNAFSSELLSGPIWHVYPKGAERVAGRIFVRRGVAGRGILKDQEK